MAALDALECLGEAQKFKARKMPLRQLNTQILEGVEPLDSGPVHALFQAVEQGLVHALPGDARRLV